MFPREGKGGSLSDIRFIDIQNFKFGKYSMSFAYIHSTGGGSWLCDGDVISPYPWSRLQTSGWGGTGTVY